jgi:hypothetical protein
LTMNNRFFLTLHHSKLEKIEKSPVASPLPFGIP